MNTLKTSPHSERKGDYGDKCHKTNFQTMTIYEAIETVDEEEEVAEIQP